MIGIWKKIIYQSQNSQKKSGEKAHHRYETYKNTAMPHGHHTFEQAYDMAQATMCAYPPSNHALTHWKCLLRWCANCLCINLPYQETDNCNTHNTLN